MAENISEIKKIVKAGIDIANAADAFAHFDYNLALKQVLDLDEAEAMEIAQDFQVLDLANDAFEAKMEEMVMKGAAPAAFVLRLVKAFFPKKP